MAARQAGFVTRRTLQDLAVPTTTIESWLRHGRLIRVWPCVYAVGHLPQARLAQARAATLAVGDEAALAGASAAAFYAAIRRWPQPFEVIGCRRCRIRGIRVRPAPNLAGRDIWTFAEHGGLRVTSPARTVLDLAPQIAADDRLRAIVDHLRLRHHLSLGQLADICARNGRHPGARRLDAILPALPERAARSRLERERWPAFARAHGIGRYRTNVIIGGHEVDVLVEELVAVEIDTLGTHLLTFASDRRRDREILARTGIPVIRITDVQLQEDPAGVAGDIHAAVARRRRERPRADGRADPSDQSPGSGPGRAMW